jgi:hypothetical protein
MVDRKVEIVEAVQKLAKKESALAVEHSKTVNEYQALKAELDAIRQDEAAKLKLGF